MSQSKSKLLDIKSDFNRLAFFLHHRLTRNQLYHRHAGNQSVFSKSSPEDAVMIAVNQSIMPTYMSLPPSGQVDLRYPEIVLNQMNKSLEKVYSKRTLVLTLIDDPMLGLSAVNFVAEDKNKDVIRLSVYDIPHDRTTCEKYAFGTVIGVASPYLRIAPLDGRYGIRVDDPKTIFHVGRKKDMCRYCGEENAEKKCKDCKRKYCDRQCQCEDWMMLKHKLVCETPAVWARQGVSLPLNLKK